MTDQKNTLNAPEGSGGILGGCFPAGELVWTPFGFTPIEQIRVGDTVYCFDENKKLCVSKVKATPKHDEHEILEVHYWGGSFQCTPNHWVYIDDKNAFVCAENLWVDAPLRDRDQMVRPVSKITKIKEKVPVYNLEVETYHSFMVGKHSIWVHNGGGGKSKSPTQDPVEEISRSSIKILEILSEGPIEGFRTYLAGKYSTPDVDQIGLQGVFIDETPVANEDDSLNFQNFVFDYRNGRPTQSYIPGFGDESVSETGVGSDVIIDKPITQQLVNNQIDIIRVRIGVQLQEFEEEGGISGSSANFKILVKEGNGSFVTRVDKNISGRFATLTEYDFELPVNNVGGTVGEFSVRVESNITQDETDDSNIQKVIKFQSYSEVISAKLRYSNTAIVGMRFDAEQFSSIPKRSYEVGGRLVQIPSNATVAEDRGLDFSGLWDGTFYTPEIACSDATWQLLDLMTNKRYGLGNRLDIDKIDTASLYEISLYNNELIPDGFGGTERRYSCNALLQSKEDAHSYINFFLNNCSAHYYWSGNKVKFWQDKPGDPVAQITNANVLDGTFKYSSTDIRSRSSVCNVIWNDPEDKYRRNVEPAEVQDAIDLYGIRETDFTAPGCTSRGQARRIGLRKIYTDLLETETCSFTMAVFGVFFRPGDIIEVYDWKKPNQRYSGLVISGTTTEINLDAPVVLPAGTTYYLQLMVPNGNELSLERRAITNVAGLTQTITVSSPFSTAPKPGATWSVDVLQAQLFRVRGMKAESEDLSNVEIVCGQYDPAKEAIIEDIVLDPSNSILTIPVVANSPRNLTYQALTIGTTTEHLFDWDEPVEEIKDEFGTVIETQKDIYVSGYIFQTRQGLNGNWQNTQTTSNTEIRSTAILTPGDYYFRVRSQYLNGVVSDWVTSDVINIT